MSPGHPGGALALSANGSAEDSGIVWAAMSATQDGIHGKVQGILRANDAGTLREIWTSEQNAARDRLGTLMKFVPPVVANGRVFMPNHDGTVAVYGLLPTVTPDFIVTVTPESRTIFPWWQWRLHRDRGCARRICRHRHAECQRPTLWHNSSVFAILDRRGR